MPLSGSRFDEPVASPDPAGSRVTLTIFFDDPFWVGVVEVADEAGLSVARHVFGAEPTDPELAEFVHREYTALLCRATSSAVSDAGAPFAGPGAARRNPKRAAREAARATAVRGLSTKAHEALRLQLEEHKRERRQRSRAEREELAAYKRAVARRRAHEKHRGH
jgi:hypothetical protein